jgi:membrane associated rhomboid family serine protease
VPARATVEDRLGRLRYLVCGYIAAYGFGLTAPDSGQPMIGASGAIAGVLGAYLVMFPRARVWGLMPILFFLPLRVPARLR